MQRACVCPDHQPFHWQGAPVIASAGGLFTAGNKVAAATPTKVACVPEVDARMSKGVSFDSAWRMDTLQDTPEHPKEGSHGKAPTTSSLESPDSFRTTSSLESAPSEAPSRSVKKSKKEKFDKYYHRIPSKHMCGTHRSRFKIQTMQDFWAPSSKDAPLLQADQRTPKASKEALKLFSTESGRGLLAVYMY